MVYILKTYKASLMYHEQKSKLLFLKKKNLYFIILKHLNYPTSILYRNIN
jgi:hypothetical protein